MTNLDIVLKKLGTIVGGQDVLSKKVDLTAYRDSVHLSGPLPSAVVFPENTGEVSKVLQILNQYQIPVIPRGAGTNLCGGTLSQGETIILEMAKMDHIIEVNILDRYIAVEPAVSNMSVQKALEPHGYFFAPDPASFGVSTIGGNIGENAGGMRCVKYGVTTDNVIGVEIVLSDGQVILHNGPLHGDAGYDLTGLMHGSEGTFGIITKAWLHIIKLPEEVKTLVAVFPTLEDSVQTVSHIIGQGIIPSALEVIDHLAIQALEETRPMGYPLNAAAVLLIEVDGFAGTLESQEQRIIDICQENNVSEIRTAKTEEERQLLWLGRREALNCFVSKRPTYAQEDVAVPRAQLPEMLNIIKEITKKHSLVVASVCHAGDGNFHPTIIYDDQDEDETKRAHLAFSEMMEQAIALGGTITGEHGVGIEKLDGMKLLFSEEELSIMWRVKLAFDPKGILNPGKVIPEHITNMCYKELDQVSDTENENSSRENFLLHLKRDDMEHVFSQEEVLATYSWKSNKPSCVIKPTKATQIGMIVELAKKFKLKILPWGKGTKVSKVADSVSYDIVIDLTDLNRVIEIDGDNLTATVEAGVAFKDLQEMLYEKGYILPVDPLEPGTPSLGGMVATNSTGSLRLKYGTLKNLVLGLEVVTAEGKIIHYGGKTIKNVAGYDLRKLYVGSWGTLGIITKITVKILPLPEKAIYRIYLTDDYEVFLDYIFNVQRRDVQLTSFDIAVNDNKYYICLCVDGPPEAVDRQREILDELAVNAGNKLELVEEFADCHLISGQAFYHEHIPHNGSNKFIIKSSIRFSDIPKLIEIVQSMQKKVSITLYGHGACGIFHVIFDTNNNDLNYLITEVFQCLKRDLIFGAHTLEVGSDISLSNISLIKNEKDCINFMNAYLKESLDLDKIFTLKEQEV